MLKYSFFNLTSIDEKIEIPGNIAYGLQNFFPSVSSVIGCGGQYLGVNSPNWIFGLGALDYWVGYLGSIHYLDRVFVIGNFWKNIGKFVIGIFVQLIGFYKINWVYYLATLNSTLVVRLDSTLSFDSNDSTLGIRRAQNRRY